MITTKHCTKDVAGFSSTHVLQMDQGFRNRFRSSKDNELWKPEVWYPPLCPPEILKKELVQDENFTEIDMAARATPDLSNESFEDFVKTLTGHLSSNLHKLRAIFVWMAEQNIGCRQETKGCKNKHSPKYYLRKSHKDVVFIGTLFAKMCRVARIPCILVSGKAKGISYEPGCEDIKEQNTWAVVYVANSWRFVFPFWAFVKTRGYLKEDWMLIEDSGSPLRTRFSASEGNEISTFDEFYFLTDPNMMNYICHPYDKAKQLLAEPWTKEQFFTLPYFRPHYFSSGWHLVSPLTCVIKPEDGWCFIDFSSPGAGSKLKYKLFFDETQSGRTFPKEIQMDLYVTILKRTKNTKSVMVRLPEAGTYKLEVIGFHRNNFHRLVEFRIVCKHMAPDIRPLPPCSENGFGFGEEAVEAGLSEPSHTEGVVPVKSGEEIDMSFRVQRDVDILAKLLHSTRATDDLRDSVRIRRENAKTTVTAILPADDPEPEYSLQIATIKSSQGLYKPKGAFTNAVSYLLTSNKTLNTAIVDESKQENLQCYEEFYDSIAKDDARLLEKVAFRVKMAGIEDPILNEKIRGQKAKFKRMRKEVLAAAEERNLDRLSIALKHCMSVNLEYRGDVEDTKKVLLELCKEELKKAAKNLKVEELRERLDKISTTCIGESVREEAWFKDAQEVCWRLEELQEIKQNLQSLTDGDMANVFKPSDDVIDIFFSTFILLGESQTELNTWQKIWRKLHQTSEKQLFTTLSSFDDSLLTQDRVDLAEEKLQHCGGTFGDERAIKTLYSWCLERINFYRLREKLTRRH